MPEFITFPVIISFIGGIAVFFSLIILGPDSKISKWLYPLGMIISVVAFTMKKDWLTLSLFILFYGALYLIFFEKRNQ